MDTIKAAKRIAFLTDEIIKHNELYYNNAKPVISDREYDRLFEELQTLEADHPELAAIDSPTRRVGAEPVEGFETVVHRTPMLSLQNTYSEADLKAFDDRVKKLLDTNDYTYLCELKFDGVALSLIYENEHLTRAVTRGNGFEGDNILSNAVTITDIPLKIDNQDIIEVRGEVYMLNHDFADLNLSREEAGLPTYANPRNTTAGSLKQLDSRITSKRKLRMFSYYLDDSVPNSQKLSEDLELLEKMGFKVSSDSRVASDIDEVLNFIAEWESKRHKLPYMIDGIVIKVDEKRHHDTLGWVSRSPRWAMSYKYEPEREVTVVENITLNIGRTGAVTPTAELKPVELAGTTVKRCSIHNEDYIEEKDIRIGDTVIIEKAGEIIPQIVEVVIAKRPANSVPFKFPDEIEGMKIERKEGESAYFLAERDNQWIQKKKLEHFAGRNGMDIENLGEKIISDFVDRGWLNSISDIYRLKDKYSEITSLDGWKSKSADNLINAIEVSKTKPFEKVLYSLGIKYVGEKGAKLLAKNFPSIERLVNSNIEDMTAIHEIGDKIASAVVDWFADTKNQKLIQELDSLGLQMAARTDDHISGTNKLSGQTFVFTGELTSMKRSEAATLVELHGGREVKSVSKKTGTVVAGANAGSKLDKAQALGITVLNEEEFLAMIDNL